MDFCSNEGSSTLPLHTTTAKRGCRLSPKSASQPLKTNKFAIIRKMANLHVPPQAGSRAAAFRAPQQRLRTSRRAESSKKKHAPLDSSLVCTGIKRSSGARGTNHPAKRLERTSLFRPQVEDRVFSMCEPAVTFTVPAVSLPLSACSFRLKDAVYTAKHYYK